MSSLYNGLFSTTCPELEILPYCAHSPSAVYLDTVTAYAALTRTDGKPGAVPQSPPNPRSSRPRKQGAS